MPLSSADRKHLKGLAHSLNPVVQIGKKGLTDEVTKEIDAQLLQHELIKVKFTDLKDEKSEIAEEIIGKTKAFQAGLIGHTLILYRAHPEKPKIKLPKTKK